MWLSTYNRMRRVQLEPGRYLIRFTNDKSEWVDVESSLMDTAGHITMVLGKDGTIYNFNNVLSIKREYKYAPPE